MMVYFLARVLLLEQTFVPATLLNLRNMAFILVVFNAVRFVYYLLFVEFMRRSDAGEEPA